MGDTLSELPATPDWHSNPAISLFVERLYSRLQSPTVTAPRSDGAGATGTGGYGEHDHAGFLELTGDIFPVSANAPPAARQVTPASYEARETERVRLYQQELNRQQDLAQAAFVWSHMPQKMELRTDQTDQSLELTCDRFTAFFEAIPGLHLDKPARDLLDSLKKLSLRGNQLRIDCDASFNAGDGVPVRLRNIQADIVPDPHDRNKIHLRNISGITALGIPISEADLTTRRGDRDDILRLEIAVKNPLSPAVRRAMSALNENIPQGDWIQLQTVPLNVAGRVDAVLDELRRRPADRNYVRMAEDVAYTELPQELRDILGTITSKTKDGDKLVIGRTQDTSQDFGGLIVDLKKRIEARIAVSDREIKLDRISGIDFRVPLPPEVKKLLGMDNVQGTLKEVSLGALDADGTRRLKLTMDSGSLVQSMQIRVGTDLKPVLDRDGRMTVDIVAARTVERDGRREVIQFPISVSFDPKQIENPPRNGPDFTIRLGGNDRDYLRVAEQILQGANLSDFKDLFSGVRSISKKGDQIVVERAEKTSRDIGGITLDADKVVSFRVIHNGNDLRIAEIRGITLTLKPQMPDAVKRYLGVDIGNIPVGITGVTVTNMGEGRQRIVIDGNNFLSKVGVFLKDGAPMIEADGRWKMYAMVQCPQSDEVRRQGRPRREMGIILPFNRNNQVALKPEETAALVAQVAFQNIDPDNPRTWGLGLIAIGSQVTSSTIETARDVRARFDDGLRQIQDGTAAARFQGGLRQIGDGTTAARFRDGASQLPGRFTSGLRRIGGWLGLD